MKLSISQALRRRKKLKGELALQVPRIQQSLTHDKKDTPAFPYEEARKAHSAAKIELIELETAIAVANADNTVAWKDVDKPLCWVLRALAEIKDDITRYESYRHYGLLKERETTSTHEEADGNKVIQTPQGDGRVINERVMKTITTVTVCNVTIKECEDKIAQLKGEFEKLNDLLETANHSVHVTYQDQRSGEEKEG